MNWLHFRLVTAVAASLCCFSIGLLAYLKNRDAKLNQIFALFNLSLGLWNLGDIVITYSPPEWALFFDRLVNVWGTLLAPAFLFLALEFFRHRLQPRTIKYAIVAPAVLIIIACFTPWMIKEVRTQPYLEEVPGPLYGGFVVYFLSCVGYGIFSLFRKFRHSVGAQRNQFKYVFFAFFLGFWGAVSYFATMVNPEIPPVFYVMEMGYTAIMAYAIIKYNVMEITLAFRYGLVYFLLLAAVGAPFAALSWWLGGLAGAMVAFVAPLIGYLFIDKWKAGFTAAVDRLPPFRGRYERYEKDFVDARRNSIVNAPSLNLWAQNVLRSVRDIVGVEQLALLVHDTSYNQFVSLHSIGLPALERSPIALENDGPVAEYLRVIGDNFLLKDDLLLDVPDKHFKEINDELGLFSAQVCVPLRTQEKIGGLLMVGAKRKGEMFTKLDVESLYRIKSGAEEALRSLLSGLTQQQFSSSWAHDLMHPFGPKGSFQLLVHALQGKHGPLAPGMEKDIALILKEVGYVWEKMGALLNPLKQMKEGQYRKEEHSLTPLFERTRVKYEMAAKERGIRWIVHAPPETLQVRCDADGLEYRVILNLVDNAFRYVKAGGSVELGHHVEGASVVVFVKDTGPGVPAEKLPKLFETRVLEDKETGGKAGWGLLNAKTVVEAHGGKIWVDSQPGKGASFYFKLPLDAVESPPKEHPHAAARIA